MKQSEIPELISILHKLVHKRLYGVASAIYVKDDHLYFELMFKFNSQHASVHIDRLISIVTAFDKHVIASFLLDEAITEMKNMMINSYMREEQDE